MFEEIGSINRLSLKRKDDGFTFAFISYDEIDDAEKATMKLNRKKIGDKYISVKYAKQQGAPKNDGFQRNSNGRNFDGKKDFDGKKNFGNDNKKEWGNSKPRDGGRDGKSMKCFKCHEEGHMSKNCPEDNRRPKDEQRFDSFKTKSDPVPEEDFCDY